MTGETGRNTTKHEPKWNRGDGEPDRKLLTNAIAAVLKECGPIRIVLFGSGARGELTDESDVDLLIVVPDGTLPNGSENIAFAIHERMGHKPRTDLLVETESKVTRAAKSLAGVLRTASEDGVIIYEAGSVRPYEQRARQPPSSERRSPHKTRVETQLLLAGATTRPRARRAVRQDQPPGLRRARDRAHDVGPDGGRRRGAQGRRARTAGGHRLHRETAARMEEPGRTGRRGRDDRMRSTANRTGSARAGSPALRRTSLSGVPGAGRGRDSHGARNRPTAG